MVLAAAAVGLLLVWFLPRGNEWTTLIYLLPILWAALRYGLRGGILAASGSGICHLLGLAVLVVLVGVPGMGREVWTGRAGPADPLGGGGPGGLVAPAGGPAAGGADRVQPAVAARPGPRLGGADGGGRGEGRLHRAATCGG